MATLLVTFVLGPWASKLAWRDYFASPATWSYLTGSPEAIDRLTSRFGVSTIDDKAPAETLTHNLRTLSLRETPAWASDFDAWTADALTRRDHDLLLQYRTRAPGVRESLPTHEHFVPVLFSAGAAPDEVPTFPITGFWWNGAMTRRSVQLG